MPEYPTMFDLITGKSYMWGKPTLAIASYLVITIYFILSVAVSYLVYKLLESYKIRK
jgi:hypothetical protein